MKKLLFFLWTFILNTGISAQKWQQETDYIIDVSLNDSSKTLDGFEKITYTNNSPDTLHFIWFHLWPNAYKNDMTAFSDQLLENGNTAFYFSDRNQRGYINRLDFRVDGMNAKMEDHPEHIDIIRVVLPKPLPPNQQVVISTPFHVQLPFNFSRGGYDGESFQVSQWYPKPAVYDIHGWHPMPYLDQGEFFSEFGNYDVRITLPENYVVAATGKLSTQEEVEWLKRKVSDQQNSHDKKQESLAPAKKAPVKKAASPSSKKKFDMNAFPPSSGKLKTIRYVQENVHDFAWFADKRFLIASDTCILPSGKLVNVSSYYTPEESQYWDKSTGYAKNAIRFYSENVGEYPYDVVSIVQGPKSFGGGMEYPTITIIAPIPSDEELERTIVHEVGHNWFYGILASNERENPWMDEGINTFYEQSYMRNHYGIEPGESSLLYQTKILRKTAQPFTTSSEKLSVMNYELAAYDATATWMKSLEGQLGKESFQKLMHEYFETWKFRHPYPDDFLEIAKKYSGNDTELLKSIGKPSIPEYKGFSVVSPFIRNSIKGYIRKPVKDILFVSPALGLNSYDKLMIGGVLMNYKLPPNHFQYLINAMYGTGSKNFTGIGKLNYAFQSDGIIRKTDVFVNGSTFTMNEFRDSADRKLFMNFYKLVPGVRITFREKDARSTIRKSLQWKTFFVNEQSLRISQDTSITGTDTALFLHYYLPKKSYWINQLQFYYENSRALYPYDFTLQVEQGKDFLRPTFTGHYFFNYSEGGLQLRLFAGKFLYLKEKTITTQFQNDRYFLNMTGPNGFEDYTYSDYFIGRNKFDEFQSQQIMIRDGAFKTRTDLLASKIGKTDNWLAAINLNTSIPKKLNPLSVLPINIPLHLFLDIGTYAEAWDQDADLDRILFDAGFHIPLFHESINIFIPVLYNKVYSDYYKSTIPKNRFLKTISFSINLYNKDIRKINHELEF